MHCLKLCKATEGAHIKTMSIFEIDEHLRAPMPNSALSPDVDRSEDRMGRVRNRKFPKSSLADGTMGSAAHILSIEPRGLNRTQAAAYVGVSPSLFDQMIADGRMPAPKIINSRRVWDRRELDVSFEALPTKEEGDPWDRVLSA